MALTKHQQTIFDSIVDDIESAIAGNEDKKIISLLGSAGTGKTYLLSTIVSYFKHKYSICVVSPTHKACGVIRETLKHDIGDDDIDVRTIHSFLKLKLEPDLNTGVPILKQDSWNKSHNQTTILCCDESSMISDELLSYSADKLENNTVKVILLVGDIFQLKPVDDDETSEYITANTTYKLTEIVRQAEDNPIIRTSVVLKKFIEKQKFPKFTERIFKLHTVVHSKREFLDLYFADESDKMVGSFTKRVINGDGGYNPTIRNQIKGFPDDYVIEGDEFIFYDTLFEGNSILKANSDISTIQSCVKIKDSKYDVYYWQVQDTDFVRYKILDIEYQEKLNNTLNSIASQANESQGQVRRKLWGQYYALKNRYANVKYNYASTLHRLQGTTVTNIYLDFSDLHNDFYDVDTVFRLAYVGITRARKNAIILI
jgi:exodeoxyribonuclease-5